MAHAALKHHGGPATGVLPGKLRASLPRFLELAPRIGDNQLMKTQCARCKATMTCDPRGSCWCAELPHGPAPSAAEAAACLCPVCLCEQLGCRLDLLGKSAAELRALMAAFGEPAYRGTQLYHSIYAARRFDFSAMTDLPAPLRTRLAAATSIALPEISRRYRSSDGSVRYLVSLAGTNPSSGRSAEVPPGRVETVFMPSEGRQTICISTQAGCAVDCKFCLTAQLGLIRNLTAGEIVGQVLLALEDHRDSLAPRTNVVLMGQGEPLLNYDAVMAAVRILLDPNGMALAPRHVTLSTSGIVPGIERLAQEKVRPKLAISLNASSNEQRDAIMPINRKYPLEALLEACRHYTLGSREWLTFEYVLLGGFNDAPEDARRVVRLLSGLRAKVNLIPWNPGAPVKGAAIESDLPFRTPSPSRIEEFRSLLIGKGLPAFVRYSRGQDIAAACGQLALIESPAQISSATLSAGSSPPA
jgi:23S rRNA (adenine2503-C2)-methyltransferase